MWTLDAFGTAGIGSLTRSDVFLSLQKRLLQTAIAAISFCFIDSASLAQSNPVTPSQTIIPNVVPGISYIRLSGDNTTEFEVKALGSVTGTLYNSMVIAGTGSSRQYTASELLGFKQLNAPDSTASLIIKGKRPGLSDIAGLYQHVRYNPATRVFENMNECALNIAANDRGYYRNYIGNIGVQVSHVHTSRLAGYTSYISISNPDNVTRSFRILGRVPGPSSTTAFSQVVAVPAGGTTKVSVPQLEQQSGFTPPSDLLHINVFVTYAGSNSPPYNSTAVISHTVVNDGSMVETNLTQFCPVEGVSVVNNPLGTQPYAETRVETSSCIRGGWEIWPGENCPVIDFPASITTAGEARGDLSVGGGSGSGAAANGQIYPAGDVDWYKVKLEKGGGYQMYVTPSPASFQASSPTRTNDALAKSRVSVFDATGKKIGISVPNGDNRINFTPTEGGDYFIEVEATDAESTGGYQLVVNSIFKEDPCSPLNPLDRFVGEISCNLTEADFPANDTTSGLACISCRFGPRGSILPAGDVDWLRVQLVAGTTYAFQANLSRHPATTPPSRLEDGFALKLKARLVSRAGTELKSANGTELLLLSQDPAGDTPGPARFVFTATETGPHYIEITSRNDKPLSYSIEVNR